MPQIREVGSLKRFWNLVKRNLRKQTPRGVLIAIFRDLHDILISTNLPTPFCWARIYRIQSGESLTVLSAGQGWVSSRKDGAWRKLRIDPMSAFGIGAKSIRLATRQVCPRNDMEPDFVLAVAANGRFGDPETCRNAQIE